MNYLVGTLPENESACLALCRAFRSWEICCDAGQLNIRRPLRSTSQNSADEQAWNALPFVGRYHTDPAGRLIPVGSRVPTQEAPRGFWKPLHEWLAVAAPRYQFPAGPPTPLRFRPVRSSDNERPVDWWMTTKEVWIEWALAAPLARLECLQFAAASDGRVLLCGTPRAPVPGTPWLLHGQIALPVGWSFPGDLRPAWLAKGLRLGPADTALWFPEGAIEKLPDGAFIRASRAAVRATFGLIEQTSSV